MPVVSLSNSTYRYIIVHINRPKQIILLYICVIHESTCGNVSKRLRGPPHKNPNRKVGIIGPPHKNPIRKVGINGLIVTICDCLSCMCLLINPSENSKGAICNTRQNSDRESMKLKEI